MQTDIIRFIDDESKQECMAVAGYLYNLCSNSKHLDRYKSLLMLLQALIVRLKYVHISVLHIQDSVLAS